MDRYQFYDFLTNCSQVTASDPTLGRTCSFCDTISFEERWIKKIKDSTFMRLSLKIIWVHVWRKLVKIWRRSREKTEYCTFQNVHYCNRRGLNVQYWLWSAWWVESGVL